MTAPAHGAPHPYSSPYAAGAGLGVVLLASYILAGRGLGATGAFAVVAANTLNTAAPAAVQGNAWLAERATGAVLGDWLVVEIIGVVIGGFVSAALAGRLRFAVDRGPRLGAAPRIAIAALGGAVMGFGAVFARGCTSGQALTGGALLSAGSWLFVLGAFGAGYLTMFFVRRAWT
ncbi:MAG: YeeE/YedE thiosulfate transporter family protein [Gemmatimonadaceae bacterium]